MTIPNATSEVALAGLTLQHGSTSGNGGGIYNGGTLTIASSTLSGNSAGAAGGEGIDNASGAATLPATIVAGSVAGGNCHGTITSNGYNLSSDYTCRLSGPGDLSNTDLKLGALRNNGGPTQT